MTGLWMLPFGRGTVARLTQSGTAISGIAHVMGGPVRDNGRISGPGRVVGHLLASLSKLVGATGFEPATP